MLSICIPTYDTDCSELLNNLYKQIRQLDKAIEVLVCDDFSTNHLLKNQKACNQNRFFFFKNKKNLGRISTRKKLAKNSSYGWLLFIDADMIPKTDEYVFKYINFIKSNKADIAIGGCCYQNENKTFNLRLRYGRNREEISAEKRQLNPYNSILFGNVLIKKELFSEVFDDFSDNAYGEDIYLSSSLKSLNKDVIHLPNETYHLGLENNREFVKKIERSGEMHARLVSDSTLDLSHIKIVRIYSLLKRHKLHNLIKLALTITNPFFKVVLYVLGAPMLFVDLLKLFYFLKGK